MSNFTEISTTNAIHHEINETINREALHIMYKQFRRTHTSINTVLVSTIGKYIFFTSKSSGMIIILMAKRCDLASSFLVLTHWGQVTHICVDNLTIIGSDNGLSPGRRQAIICTNAGILLIGPLGTNFSEILIQIQTFSLRKMHLKMSSAKWRQFRLDLNVLIGWRYGKL